MKPTFLIMTALAIIIAGGIGFAALRNRVITSTTPVPLDQTPKMDTNQDLSKAPAILSDEEPGAAVLTTHGPILLLLLNC